MTLDSDDIAAIVAGLTASAWGTFIHAQAALISASAAAAPSETPGVFGDTLLAETDCRYVKPIVFPGVDFTGWTAIAFTIKQKSSEDDDGEALLTYRASNPAAAGTDGILLHRRAPVLAGDVLRGKASIVIDTLAPDALITLTLNAEALNLPPSPDNLPYTYEIDLYRAGDKEQRGKGDFVLAQSVRRSPTIP